jgi:hypothetical protein
VWVLVQVMSQISAYNTGYRWYVSYLPTQELEAGENAVVLGWGQLGDGKKIFFSLNNGTNSKWYFPCHKK